MKAMSEKIREKSNYRLDWTIKDENGDAVTPLSLSWSLTDLAGNVINSRSAVAVSPLASSFSILLTGDDLKLTNPPAEAWKPYYEQRLVTVQATYNPGTGTAYLKESAKLMVWNEAGVS